MSFFAHRSDGIIKIMVVSPSHVSIENDKEGLETAWRKLTDSNDAINFSKVKQLAVSYGYVRFSLPLIGLFTLSKISGVGTGSEPEILFKSFHTVNISIRLRSGYSML